MKFIVIASKKDKAGLNICSFISKLPIIYTEKEIIYAENIDENIDADFIIFASKHQGKKGKMLSIHAPGNWDKAELGGREEKICRTSGNIMKIFFQELNKNIPKDWAASLECTHHGPYIEKPCLFIEIGSSEKDWETKQAGKSIAKTIENSVKLINNKKEKYKTAIGIGGPHYCPNFNKIQLNSNLALSHIIPQYIFPVTEEMLKEAVNKTQEKTDLLLLDWKGMKSEERQKIIKILEKLNLNYKKTSEIEK